MKKLAAYTLSLFLSVFFLPTIQVFGGGDFDGVFRPPSLNVNQILDVDGRYEALVQRFGYDPLNRELQDRVLDVAGRREAFRARFGYYPGEEIVEDEVILLNEELPEIQNNLGVFASALQSEAARRLRLAEVDADADLEACMEAFANMLNDEANAVVPPPPPPLPVVVGNMGGIVVNPRIVVAASSNGGNHELSLAEQAVIAQKAMQERREAKQKSKDDEEQKEEVAQKLPPSDPHMQALFAAVEARNLIVEQQLEVEAAMRAEEERLRLLEEEERLSRLNQEELEREARLKAQQEKEAQERAAALKAQQEKEAQEQARLRAMKQQVLAGIGGGVVPKLKTTRLTKKKKARSHSFAGNSSPRETVVQQPIHSSLIITNYVPGESDERNDTDWSELQGLFDDLKKEDEMSSSSSSDHDSKKEEVQKPAQGSSWSFWDPRTWFSATSEAQIQEIEVVQVDQVEAIWNEIAEIVQLIDIGLPQNMMDSQVGIGPGQQFMLEMMQLWGAGFHRYYYYPAVVRVIRERYEEASRIIAEELNHDEIDPGVSAAMGEALDCIGIILKGMDTWMQTYSSRVAQENINPSPSDFLIKVFPVFTGTMESTHARLKALFEKKGAGRVSINPLELGRDHVLDSMKVVFEELEVAESKIAAVKITD